MWRQAIARHGWRVTVSRGRFMQTVALSPAEARPFALVDSRPLNHDTVLLRFALPTKEHVLGCPVSSCMSAIVPVSGNEPLAKSYTPVSLPDTKGFFDLVVKTYAAPGGVVSRHLASLRPGQTQLFKGPWMKLPYTANKWKHIGMLAGGSGLTPMLQVIDAVLGNPLDTTRVTLVFGNRSERDIFFRSELDQRATSHPDRFAVHYMLESAPPSWPADLVGHVTADTVRKFMPAPAASSLVLVCGTNAMLETICGPKIKGKPPMQGPLQGILAQLGYSVDQVYKF